MGSFGNQDHSRIYDLSIREIELIMKKLEIDNMTLRRELHEARVKLNDKDEEILKLQRELLSQKKDTLSAHRKIMTLTEEFKMAMEGPGEEVPVSQMMMGIPTLQKSPATTTSVGIDDYMSACSEDEQHVRAPFSYQYRHLKLHPNTNTTTAAATSTTVSSQEDDEKYTLRSRDDSRREQFAN